MTETEVFAVSDEIRNLMESDQFKNKLETPVDTGDTAAQEAVAEAAKLAAENNGGAGGEVDEGGAGAGSTVDEDEELSPIEALAQQYGLAADDELLQDLDIKDSSIDTIKKFFDKRELKVAKAAIAEFADSDEDIADLIKHKQSGGSVDSWKAKKEAENFDVVFTKEDVDVQINIIKADLKEKGITGKKADALIEAAKDDDSLFDDAKLIVDSAKAALAQQAADQLAIETKANNDAKVAQAAALKEVKAVLASRNIDGRIAIPENKVAEFEKFILDPKAREAKYDKLTTKQWMILDYLVDNNFEGIKGLEAPKAGGKVKQVVVTGKSKLAGQGGEGGGGGDDSLSFEDAMKKLRKP